ncbi:putative MFS family arabinose efflux permease [Dongia mobilis]|uniref:Putative MFS family arabinose efflux permease n=1 Tax=Dongia mobilis TaxID=578943 RepID=A0A4V3DFB1_9PROT|nr:MFS transporter [Dongia mobilis]TDQ84241.1 putative MFS family arabinose efflux permease [Dongia mobilis]
MSEAPRPDQSTFNLLPWLVVGFAFLALALAFSARAATGLVMPIWESELGWSRSHVSNTVAVTLLVMAGLAPIAGRMVDRHGVRVLLAGGLVLIGIGCLAIAATSNRFVFSLALAVIAGAGFSIVATHVVSTAIARLFERNRGLALGIATSGSTGGQFLIVPLIALVLAQFSWRWSYAAIGIACLMLAPLLWRMLAPRPGSAAAHHGSQGSFAADTAYLLTKPAFHILFWSFLLCGFTTTGVIETHLMPYAQFCGFGPVTSATAYGLLSAVNMLGMIFSGWLTDRMNRVTLLGGIYVLRGLTFIVLLNIGVEVELLMVFAVLFGIFDYSTVPPTASLAASHLGLRVMGLAMGLISAGHSLGGALGAMAGGYLFDNIGTYEWIWLSSIFLAILAGLMVFLMRDRGTGRLAPLPAE